MLKINYEFLPNCRFFNTFENIEWSSGTSLNNEIIIEVCDVNQCYVIANPTPDDGLLPG
ncbi:MAG: hypothetical protein IPN46_14385 [Saprospiraceae bacterium]|nr:hypothetical protein [Saprospiraceae bacterium]